MSSGTCPYKGKQCKRAQCPRSGCGFRALMDKVQKYRRRYGQNDHQIMNSLLNQIQNRWNMLTSRAPGKAIGTVFENFILNDLRSRQGRTLVVRKGSRKNRVHIMGVPLYTPDLLVYDANTKRLRTIVEIKIYASAQDIMAILALILSQSAKVALVTFHDVRGDLRKALQQMQANWQGRFRYFCVVESPSAALDGLAAFV